jgi:UDP-2,3-diacylglucosamine pyrophosphatase LpxH
MELERSAGVEFMSMAFNKHLFLSYVHLGAFSEATNKQLEESLIKLLDAAEANRWKIYLLGDLFDYWMEFRNGHKPDLAHRLLERFEAYNRAMGPTLYITGNHDNWTRSYFEEIGFDVEPEYRELNIDDTRIFLHHGDGLTDQRFRFPRPLLHRLLRHPLFLMIYQNILPNALALRLMQWFSNNSRGEELYYGHEIYKHNQWAKWFLSQFDYDAMIFGHDHKARSQSLNQKCFVNCGAYFVGRTLACYTKQKLQLVRWNDHSNHLETVTDS